MANRKVHLGCAPARRTSIHGAYTWSRLLPASSHRLSTTPVYSSTPCSSSEPRLLHIDPADGNAVGTVNAGGDFHTARPAPRVDLLPSRLAVHYHGTHPFGA